MAQIIPGSFKILSVRLGVNTNINLSTALEQGDVIDGVTLVEDDRILVFAQTNQIDNGVYQVQMTGAPIRSFDAEIGMRFASATIAIEEGTVLRDTRWVCISNANNDVIGTNNLIFQQISGVGVDGNVISAESSTIDNQITLYSGTGGRNIKKSTATIDSGNNIGNIGYVQFADIAAPANPANGQARLYKKTGNNGLFWKPDSAGPEINVAASGSGTASNVGVGGVGVYKQKTGNNFELRNINSASNKIDVTLDDANNEIDIDVCQENLDLNCIGGVLDVENGGTGKDCLDSGKILQGNGTGPILDTLCAPTGDIVGTTDTQTLENKSLIDFTTFIINGLDNSKRLQIQCNGISTATTRELTAPDTSDTFAVLVYPQTFTNKTITDSTNNVTANSLRSLTTSIDISGAAAPSNLFCLRATSSTTATWQNIWIEQRNLTSLVVGDTTNTAMTSAVNNTIIGRRAGAALSAGTDNILIGFSAGQLLTTQGFNTMVGANAGFSNTGSQNTFLGEYAGYNQTSGSNNTSIGSDCFGIGGPYTGSNNTYVGCRASTSAVGDANSVGVGYETKAGAGGIALGYISTAAANELAVRSGAGTYVLKATATALTLSATTSTINLGANIMTFPTATQTIAGLTSAQTFTNKTITDTTNNVTANGLRSATTTVAVSAAAAPSTGQVLRATSTTTATWQDPPDIGIVWRGAWVSQNYIVDDAVSYGGSSYICKLNTIGNALPTNTTYWDILAQQGASGSVGSGSNIIVRDESVLVTATPHTELNFIGPGVTVTNGGSGRADITIAPVFGMGFQQATDDAESTTTSTAFVQKLRLTTASLVSGVYRIGYNYHWRHTGASTNFRAQIQLNDSITIMSSDVEPQDVAATQSHPVSGFYYTGTISGVQFIDMDYASSNAASTSGIRFCRLEIWRVS